MLSRSAIRLSSHVRRQPMRQLSFRSSAQSPAAAGAASRSSRVLPAALAAGTAALAAAFAWQLRDRQQKIAFAAAASTDNVQPTVYSETKDHALYLTIHLNPRADKKSVAKVVANLQRLVDDICPPDMRDESDELWAGVGFGYSFHSQVLGRPSRDFSCAERSGALGSMPSTGGDLFIHAKSNQVSKLFELCQAVTQSLPGDSIKSFEDVYSFVYRNGRDLSGFIDGTENPADEEWRKRVAVAPGGGSYAITQKWLHNHAKIRSYRPNELESFIGRSLPDSTELHRKSISSHVARMTGGSEFEQKKKFEIVRQSMPFGSVAGDSGLFFIAYAASPDGFNWMLDRMVGSAGDQHCDDVMRLSQCVQGNFWYFPSVSELAKLA